MTRPTYLGRRGIRYTAFLAAQARLLLLCLAALCQSAFVNVPKASLLTQKPDQRGADFALTLHWAESAAKALIAPGIAGCLCDEGSRFRDVGVFSGGWDSVVRAAKCGGGDWPRRPGGWS